MQASSNQLPGERHLYEWILEDVGLSREAKDTPETISQSSIFVMVKVALHPLV